MNETEGKLIKYNCFYVNCEISLVIIILSASTYKTAKLMWNKTFADIL